MTLHRIVITDEEGNLTAEFFGRTPDIVRQSAIEWFRKKLDESNTGDYSKANATRIESHSYEID